MLFNSLDFAIFFPLVFLFYWGVFRKNLSHQNLFLVVVSYVFYGWWDWRFLLLILFSTLVDFVIGNNIQKASTKARKKQFLITSLLINLGLLGFFKYYNFFVKSFVESFTFFGQPIENSFSLNIILPVGISFYTFQTLSYSIDVYREKLHPTQNFIEFAAFVSFFPQLVAGPIERAKHLLPQIQKKRNFDVKLAENGLRQILWGLFKKVVIADNCAYFVNIIFENPDQYHGSTLVLGAFLFALQIYGDFSGYSDMAIGLSRLLGFDIMKNFAFPYFSRDIAEFWRRWHISLSTWFRDYLYIPLGGSRGQKTKVIRNVFIIFIVSGLWHGANWTFIAWGFINALYFLPFLLMDKNRTHLDVVAKNRLLPTVKEVVQISFTFSLCLLAWIFFRADSITQAFEYIKRMITTLHIGIGYPLKLMEGKYYILFFIALFFIFEWSFRNKEFGLDFTVSKTNKTFRWVVYIVLIFSILWYGGSQEDFIYFQF